MGTLMAVVAAMWKREEFGRYKGDIKEVYL